MLKMFNLSMIMRKQSRRLLKKKIHAMGRKKKKQRNLLRLKYTEEI